MFNRDGSLVSLWQGNSETYTGIVFNGSKEVYDVIIAGGGITGISTALELQKSGLNCLVLEASNIGFGTTGGTTAHINTLLDTPYTLIKKNFGEDNAKLVASATSEAIQLIQTNIDSYGISCGFEKVYAYLFAQDDKQEKELASIQEASAAVGLDINYSNKIPLPIPFTKAIRAADQAKFNPIEYVYGLARAFEQAGGTILQNCRLDEVDDDELIAASTSRGVFKGKSLIYATHIPPGVNLVHLRCLPYRSYAMAVTLTNTDYPTDLAYDMYDPYHYYRTQIVNGKSYLIAGGRDHKTAHDENSQHRFEDLESHLRKYFNIASIEYRWSSQFFEPADGLPYIGHLPGHPGRIYIATGFGGNGMPYSHVAARLLSSMIQDQESPYMKLFDPNRIKPVAGFSNFIQHNANVVKEFIGKWFAATELSELSEMAPGEAKVVKYEGKKVALYKDENGKLHAINPICTHLNCEVKWNNAEKSWDCPCHGARYNFEGKVITGPANADLEKIELRELVQK